MNPPRLATWLLHRWGWGPNRESLVGDLVEQYQVGRSPVWYWRQVVKAVVLGAVHDIRDHKWLAVRAVGIGFAAVWVFSPLARWLLYTLQVLTNGGLDVGQYRIVLGPGWGRHPEVVSIALAFFESVGSGWIVARFNRRHRGSMIFAYLVSAELVELIQTLAQLLIVGVVPIHSYAGSGRTPPLVPVTLLLFFPVVAIGILIGGLADATEAQSSPSLKAVTPSS